MKERAVFSIHWSLFTKVGVKACGLTLGPECLGKYFWDKGQRQR